MKTTISLLLLLVNLFAYGQKVEQFFDYNWKPCAPEKARYYTSIEKKDSVWLRQDYYIREKWLQMEGTYLDQETKIAHGKVTYYHPNKQLEGTGNFINGKRNGLWMWFHENGMMSDSSYYKDDHLIGTSLRWYPDGMI